MEHILERMWDSNRDYIRHVLISLSRNVDLADDLLQETYLKARGGISGYRGGDPRAWLVAIAKNAFLAHSRRRYVSSEFPLDPEVHIDPNNRTDTGEYLNILDLRRAVSDLKPELRTALLMKHYGGFSYAEIGNRQNCPEGTARRRVWSAIQKLRTVLSQPKEERLDMRCEQIRGSRLLDYIYGTLQEEQARKFQDHLENCSFCRSEAEEYRKLMKALNSTEGDYKLSRIIDIDSNGMPTQYDWWTFTNTGENVMEMTWWTVNKDHCVDYITIQGEEVVMDVLPSSQTQYKYQTHIPRSLKPGEAMDEVFVAHPKGPEDWAERLEDGLWRFQYATSPNTAKEWFMSLAIRLPAGSKLTRVDPEPAETRTDGTTTLIWKSLLPSLWPQKPEGWKSDFQFECAIAYKLTPTGPVVTINDTPSEWAKTHVKWSPELLSDRS